MKRKIISLFIVTVLISTTVALPVFAETGSTVVRDDDKTVEDDIVTTEDVGADAEAFTTDASVEAQDVTVDYNGDSTIVVGLCADTHADGVEAYASAEDVNVSATGATQTLGIQASIQEPGGDACVFADNVTVNSDASSVVPGSWPKIMTVGVSAAGIGGYAQANVEGDISVSGTVGESYGVCAESLHDQGESSVYLNGNMDVTGQDSACGLRVYAGDGSATYVTPLSESGTISVDSSRFAIGVLSETFEGGYIECYTNSDVDVRSDNNAIGVYAYSSGIESSNRVGIGNLTVDSGKSEGISLSVAKDDDSFAHVEVYNDLTVKGTDSVGINMIGEGDSGQYDAMALVNIGGDVTSDGVGIKAVKMDQMCSQVFIKGTLSAKDGPAIIVDDSSAEDLDITVWKVESSNNPLVMEDVDGARVRTERAEDFEKSINYLLCIKESQDDNIDFLYGTNDSMYYSLREGESGLYPTATEGTKVGIKLEIPDGYRLGGVYSDEERKASLLVDDEGNYYLIVPKGGGVLVNMVLIPIEEDDDDDKKSEITVTSNDNITAPSGPFVVSNGVAVASIAAGTDTISMTSAQLLSYLAMGVQSIMITTPSGTFNIPLDAELLAILQNVSQIRFVLNGNVLELYVDGQTAPVKVVAL